MALITPGTKCVLCQQVLDTRPVVAFGHFCRNRRDPLFIFSDAAVHPACFEASPLRDQVRRRVQERKLRMGERTCEVCRSAVLGDWYTTDHLTDDPADPLFRFNYLHFHRAHLPAWSELDRFRDLIREFQSSERYDGPPILPEGL